MWWLGGTVPASKGCEASPPVSRQIRAHRRSRALPGSLSPHRDSGCHSAKDHPTTSRRRRCRLRSGSTVHDWPLPPQRSQSSTADFVDREEQEPVTAVASVGALRNGRSGETMNHRGGDTAGFAHQTQGGSNRCRRKRQRRRQRLRLQTLGNIEVGAAEALVAMEANIVEAESLGLEAAIRPSTGVGAAVAPSIVDNEANVANRERRKRQQQLLQVDGVVSTDEIATRDDVDADLYRSGGKDVSCSGSGSFSEERSSTSTGTRPSATGGLEASQLMAEQAETLLQGRHTNAVQENFASEVPKYSEEDDDRFMRMALRLAGRARMEGEVPIGAILAETATTRRDGRRRVLSTGRNEVEGRRDASAHAEMLCLQAAAKARGNWRLAGTTLYVTVEPCAMCLSAAQLFRVDRVVFGAPNPNLGACGGWVDLSSQRHAFHELEVKGGVLAEECALPLRGFFRSRRREEEIASAGDGVADTP
ncbi:unnamed protein product [Ectocarpus sp. CCAP 1310/34]|nr:unnamed protein product [Ectocarpus sp. CCAP 1310/34]